jgi:hypothetical protein
MFEKWRTRKDFDLSQVDVPRSAGTGPIRVEAIMPLVPFVYDDNGEPTVIVRLSGVPDDEVAALADAVRVDRCVLLAALRLYSTYPVLIYSLFVFDSPSRPPLSVEGYRDVTVADVQDFVVRLGQTRGRGRVRLYNGGGELLATGRFTLRIPPCITAPLPHETSWRELSMLWSMFTVAARQRARIPEQDLDFKAAAATHMARQPNLTLESDPLKD